MSSVRAHSILFGSEDFDFVTDLGAFMPMRTIGYLFGIHEEGQQQIRDLNDQRITVGGGSRRPQPQRPSRNRSGCSSSTSSGGRRIRPTT